jgi:hypothetical protein
MKKQFQLAFLSFSILATATTPALDGTAASVLVGSGIGAAIGALTMIYNMDLSPGSTVTIENSSSCPNCRLCKIKSWLYKHRTALKWTSAIAVGTLAGGLSAYRLHTLLVAMITATASQGIPDFTDAHPLTKEQALKERALKILELQPKVTYTQDDMKKAYRRLMLVYHPDKQKNKTTEEQKTAAEKAKDLNNAKRYLGF